MRRFMLPTIAVLALTLTLSGCGWLFGPSVDQVKPGDLESYDADRTFSDTSESGVYTTTGGVTTAGGYAFGEIFERVGTELNGTASVASVEDAFQALVQQTTRDVQARALAAADRPSASVSAVDNAPDDPDTVDITIDVVNETVDADTDLGLASGTATVDFYLDLYGTGEETDNGDGTVTVTGSGEGEHDGAVSYTNWSDGEYVVHEGRINTTASGSFDVDVTTDTTTGDGYGTVEWQFGMAMSAGFSVSRPDGSEGGKIIIEYTYDANDSVTVDEGEDPYTQATGEIDAKMTVVIYDNDDDEVARYEYTSQEAAGIAL